MKLLALTALFAFLGTAVAPPPPPTHTPIPAPPAPAPPAPAPPAPAPPAPPGSSTTATTTGTTTTAASSSSSGFLPPGQAATGIFSYTSGKPAEPTLPLTASYQAGATPPVAGAPPLPTAFQFVQADWPAQDKVPDTNSPEVQNWMRELEGFYIPEYPPTVNGSCALNPDAVAQAPDRGWWTCGGHTRATDITACPDKLTWGVSFDDGPSPYTPSLLKYLTDKKLLATFFVVGSRVIERPSMLIEQYMTGHEISVHTWSHKPLTSLTTDQIVAELGWTRKAIKEVLGVTPTTMRPPYGDIDDRVRAISLAMGMQPIIWTRTPVTGQFDTNDWMVAGGLVSGAQSFQTFQAILTNATQIDTGFIVLQHDLYDITVELATHFTLDAAINNNPPLTLKPIGQCLKYPASNLYLESTTNATFPYRNHSMDIDGDGKADSLIASAVVGYTPGIGLVSLIGAFMLAGLLA